ncbi:hypothetical protein E4T56_gene12200 [Termitomyces sp. T112]|nr:hypothetical protein E4T56_gene12200 [Termitomyces sp. T112]
MTCSLDPNTAPSPPPLQCSTKLLNPCPPSTPTSGNSDTSSADPNSSLINSNAFSAAVDAPLKFPWTPKAFPDPGTICFPTDPIRMSPQPIPRSHLTTTLHSSVKPTAISFALLSHPVVVYSLPPEEYSSNTLPLRSVEMDGHWVNSPSPAPPHHPPPLS